jgi:uncharacterized repeat protein (TIGR03803 family)
MRIFRTLTVSAGLLLASTSAQAADFTLLGGFDYSTQGGNPQGVTFDNQGNLWGVLQSGYYDNNISQYIDGSVFKYSPATGVSIVKEFKNYLDGSTPIGKLLLAADGNMYGATVNGTSSVFKITPNGDFTALGSAGNPAYGGLVQGNDGALYGQTIYGGNVAYNGGTLFKYQNGTFTTLADIGTVGGREPRGAVAFDAAGNIYGTSTGVWGQGGAIMYKYDTNGQLTKVADFGTGFTGGITGEGGGPMLGPDGNIYGLVYSFQGSGSIYKFDTATQTMSTFFDFGSTNLKSPMGKLLFDANGTMWGVAQGDWYGQYGGVFSLTSAGVFTNVHSFEYGPPNYDQPFYPSAGLTADAQGNLYGVLGSGGSGFNGGGMFKLANTGFAVAGGGGGGGGGGGAVPEPASWAMLIAGFGLSGAAMRRRRRAAALPA